MTANYLIGQWTLNTSLSHIKYQDQVKQLSKQQLALLMAFIAAPEQTLTKEQLFEQVWPNKVVSEDALTRAISDLRKLLKIDNDDIQYFKTLHGFGYSLIVQAQNSHEQRAREQGTNEQKIRDISHKIITVTAVFFFILFFAYFTLFNKTPTTIDDWPIQLETQFTVQSENKHFIALYSSESKLYLQSSDESNGIYLINHHNENRLYQSKNALSNFIVSPEGKQLAFIELGENCSVKSVAILSGELTTYGQCDQLVNNKSFGLNWQDENSLLLAQMASQKDVQLIKLSSTARPIITSFSGSQCESISHVFHTRDANYISCNISRGDALYSLDNDTIELILRYRSIRKFAIALDGTFYFSHNTSWKTGLTSYTPTTDNFAFANTGWLSDFNLFNNTLVLVRNLTNSNVVANNLSDLSFTDLETSYVQTNAITVDPIDGSFWSLNNKTGQFSIFKNSKLVFSQSDVSLDLSQVVSMVNDQSNQWMMLTTGSDNAFTHHWFDITNKPTLIHKASSTSKRVNVIENKVIYISKLHTEHNAFDIEKMQSEMVDITNEAKLNHKIDTNQKCFIPAIKTRHTTIKISQQLDALTLQEFTTLGNDALRTWTLDLVDSLCDIENIVLDEQKNRLLLQLRQQNYKDLSYLRL